MRHVAVVPKSQVARPLKILVPLIQNELMEGDTAGLGHYLHAGEMLTEAKGQVSHGSWSRWLTKNFALSQKTAGRYMRLARMKAETGKLDAGDKTGGLSAAIGEKHSKNISVKTRLKSLFEAVDHVDVEHLADERQSQANEIKLHREMAVQLIDLGYRALATRLHPDRGGSRDAMERLNVVRDELKSVAATRRFV
jgi:hypothetical protein